MINYSYIKYEELIPKVDKKIKAYLEDSHNNRIKNNRALYNTKRRIKDDDIKTIISEYFKDLALWLESPNTASYRLADLGYIKISFLTIDSFINRILIPRLRVPNTPHLEQTKKRLSILWKLRQVKYISYIDKLRKREYAELKNKEGRSFKQPTVTFGDSFDVRKIKLEDRLLTNALSDNLDRVEFYNILNN